MRVLVVVMVAACGAAAPTPAPSPPERPPPPEPLVYAPLRWGMSQADVVLALDQAGMQPRRSEYGRALPATTSDPTLFADMISPPPPPDPPPKVWFVPKPGWTGEAWFTADGDHLNGVVLQAPLPAKRGHDEILRLIHRHGPPVDHRMTDMTTVQAVWARGGAHLTAIAADGQVTISYAFGF